MRHHLTAVFNNQIDARHALDELLASGYRHPDATLVSPPAVGTGSAAGGQLKQVFGRLFGTPHHALETATDAPGFLPGRHVVGVSIATEPECARAIVIIERFSPVYLEDRRT